MPNSEAHKIIGGLAGLTSLHFLPPLSLGGGSATLAGRVAGGVVGGLLPDWLEPATSPRHRSTCHSAAAGGVALTDLHIARNIEAYLQSRSAEIRHEAHGQCDAVLKFLQKVWAWVVEFFGGAAVGVVAGYVSHLVADMFTPAGLPIL